MNDIIRGVIETIRENRRRFEAFCYGLTDEQLGRPVPGSTWIVRDFAAHLGSLDVALLRWFGDAAADRTVDSTRLAEGERFDVDAYNDAQVASRRGWSLERVFAEASVNRERLIEALAPLTDEQLDRPMHFAGDSKRGPADLPLKLFLAGWAQHDPMHVYDMLKALPERSGEADLRAWLDDPFVKGYHAVMSASPSR